MELQKFIANRIYELRSTNDISGRKLGMDLGYSETFIPQIENLKKNPSIETIEKICSYFNISYSDFFKPASTVQNTSIIKTQAYNTFNELIRTASDSQIELLINFLLKMSKLFKTEISEQTSVIEPITPELENLFQATKKLSPKKINQLAKFLNQFLDD